MTEATPVSLINIAGEKVALGPLERERFVALEMRARNDFATLALRWERAPAPATREQVERLYERIVAETNAAHFLMFARASGEAIGTLELRDIDHRNRTAEYGITVSAAADRGKGYGTEATRLALDYAFTALGLHNVLLTTASFNVAALRAYTHAGFRVIGKRSQCWLMGNRWYDEIFMEALATGFTSPVLARLLTPDGGLLHRGAEDAAGGEGGNATAEG